MFIRSLRVTLLALLMCRFTAACAGNEEPEEVIDVSIGEADVADATPVSPTSGDLVVLTYNVAGLPEGLSSGTPEVHMPMISPLLGTYDLALVQEDFWYHEDLVSAVDHPHQSVPWSDEPDYLDMGDGLNRFSRSPFQGHTRTPWPGCSGTLDCSSDCLATKGSSVARHTLAEGVEVDVYNLHMEAGGCPEDYAIREASIQQLLGQMADLSEDVAVVMAGDWNLHPDDPQDLPQLHRLVEEGGLTDACWFLDCGDERIDRVFFRSGPGVTLEATQWKVPAEFIDPVGQPMSDHAPVSVTLHWSLMEGQ
jgi:hypothetical protein